MVLKCGQQLGYVRISSAGQNDARQLADLSLDRVFFDKVTGSTLNRPGLKEALKYSREGDTLHIHSIDRLGRNLNHLQSIIAELNGKGVSVRFHKENLIFSGQDDAMGKLMLQMMGAFAEFERALIRERQQDGIAKALKSGAKFGQPPKLSNDQIDEIKAMASERYSKVEIAKKFNISRPTVYRALNS